LCQTVAIIASLRKALSAVYCENHQGKLTSQVEKKSRRVGPQKRGGHAPAGAGGYLDWPGEIFARTAFLVARALSRRRLGQGAEE
jgi:hypothetical protein